MAYLGSYSTKDGSGKGIRGKSARDAIAKKKLKKSSSKKSSSKKTIVVGVETSKSGVITRQVNVGKDLTEEQRREISRAADANRLTTQVKEDSVILTSTPRSSIADSVARLTPTRERLSPVARTDEQGRVLSEPFTPGQSARSVQQEDPNFVGPRQPSNDIDSNTFFRAREQKGFFEQAPSTTFKETAQRLEFKAERNNRGINLAAATVVRAGQTVAENVEFGIKAVSKPVQTAKQLFKGAKTLLTSSEARKTLKTSFSKSFNTPSVVVGTIAGEVATGFGAGAVGRKTATVARDVSVRVVARKVPAEDVFSPVVLRGDSRFPTSSNIDELESSFRKSDFEVVTAAPAPLKGRSSELVGRGAAGTEGGGISVAPFGQGSPAFLGVEDVGGPSYSFTLNPFRTTRPTATTFTGSGIVRTPRSVTSQPGFEAENIFMREQVAGTGRLVIPKRVQLGQGVIDPQKFRAADDIVRLEKGTVETEAKIALGETFTPRREGNLLQRAAGFSEYVDVKGRPVPIRRFDININREFGVADDIAQRGSKTLDVEDVSRISSSPLTDTTRRFTPVVSVGSSRSSRAGSSRSTSSLTSSSSFSGGSTSASSSLTSSSSFSSSPISSGSSSSSSRFSSSSTFASSSGSSSSSSRFSSSLSSPISSSSPISTTFSSSTFTPPPFTSRIKSDDVSDSFAVFVRREGEFKQAGVSKKKKRAFQIGAAKVGGSAAASFKVVNVRTGQVESPIKVGKDFRVSTKEAGVLIERRERRIKSRGELRDITFKGIRSQINKRSRVL